MSSIPDPSTPGDPITPLVRPSPARLAGLAWALCAAGLVGWGGCTSTNDGKRLPDGQDPPSGQEGQKASAAGVTFEWRIDGDVLEGTMSARTRGWVTIGFNRERTLDGTRLVMGYVSGDRTVVEEHIADPPDHRSKVDLGGTSGVLSAKGREEGGITTIEFRLRLDTGDAFDVALVPGETYYTTFAWSQEDDLFHHSAERTAIDLKL